MHFSQIEQKNIRGITHAVENSRAFHCIISVDIHSNSKDSSEEALGMLYTKALLSGCGSYSREEFLSAVNLIGGSISVTLDNGILTIACTCLDTHQEKLLKLVTVMLQSPTFAPAEIKRMQVLQANELHEEKEDAKAQSVHAFVGNLYGEKDRRYCSGTESLIQATTLIKKKQIENFHKNALARQWVFTLTSNSAKLNATVSKIVKLRKSFGEIQEESAVHAPLTLTKKKTTLVLVPSKQNIEFSIGGPLPLLLLDNDFHAFVFGLNVLGKWGGFAGRLMSTVREKEGLTYGIYARTETVALTEYGYWRIMTFFAPDKSLQGLTSTIAQIKLIKEKGITQTEFDRFKTIIETGQALLNDSVIRRISDMHAYQMKGFTLATMEAFKKGMLAVTKEDVNSALKKYLDLSTLVIAGAGPVKKHEALIKAL